MSYETLDLIADSYNPFLLLISFYYLLQTYKNKDWDTLKFLIKSLILNLSIAYTLMLIDISVGLSDLMQIDFSTHTAVSLVLIIWLCKIKPNNLVFFPLTGVAYYALMLYQEYHTVADIVITAIIVSSTLIALNFLIMKKKSTVIQ